MASVDTLRTFGETLRAARLEQKRSLDDLASAIKIHRRHLEAIEAGDLTKLPQGPYVTAFVREYARSLGLAVPTEYAPPRAAPAASPKDPKVVSHPARGGGEEGIQISQVARDTARFANTAVKSAVKTVSKTTESVVSFVETGGKEALGALTSKGLWDEAEDTRRERHGLPPLERKIETPAKKVVVENLPPPTPAYKHDTLLPDEFALAPIRTSKRATNIVIALLALVFAGAAYFAIRMSRNEGGAPIANKDYVPAPVEKPQPMTVPKHENTAPTTVANAAPIVKDSLRFMLRATQPVWVSIAPDGIPAYKGELKAGEVRSFRAAQKIVVNIGNQKSVAMTFNGAPLSGLPAVQNSSVVVRDLVLMRDHVTLGGNPVDFHKLTSAPSPPPAKSVVPGVPPPAVSAEMAALAKKAKQIAAQKAKLKSAGAKGVANPASQKNSSKKNAPPSPPIHPVEPVAPGP